MAKPDYAMETGAGAKWLRWFQCFVWIGIVANVALTLTSIFCTEWVLQLVGLEPAHPLVWPRFGAFGILLLTGFYVVAAMDPCRSRWATLFTRAVPVRRRPVLRARRRPLHRVRPVRSVVRRAAGDLPLSRLAQDARRSGLAASRAAALSSR